MDESHQIEVDESLPQVTEHFLIRPVRVLAQRPITLVLMMINSCSYSTNDFMFIKFQIFNQDLN